MGTLRILLMAATAVWIWLELMVVGLPTLLDQVRGRGRRQDGASLLVLLLGAAVGFWAAVRLTHLPFGALPGPPEAWLTAGLVLMWAGLALRAWAIQHLGGLFRAVVVIQRDHRLVTTGPYRYLRHPSYTGALLAAIGFGVALGHWTSVLALAAGWAVGIAYRVRVEEAALRLAFGAAYDDYRARTRRLVPFLL